MCLRLTPQRESYELLGNLMFCHPAPLARILSIPRNHMLCVPTPQIESFEFLANHMLLLPPCQVESCGFLENVMCLLPTPPNEIPLNSWKTTWFCYLPFPAARILWILENHMFLLPTPSEDLMISQKIVWVCYPPRILWILWKSYVFATYHPRRILRIPSKPCVFST